MTMKIKDPPGPSRSAIGKAFRALREEKGRSARTWRFSTIEAVEAGTDELLFDLFCDLADAPGASLTTVVARGMEES